MKNIDLKQMELDSAAAKVDELSRQLQSLWTDSPGQAKVWTLHTATWFARLNATEKLPTAGQGTPVFVSTSLGHP